MHLFWAFLFMSVILPLGMDAAFCTFHDAVHLRIDLDTVVAW